MIDIVYIIIICISISELHGSLDTVTNVYYDEARVIHETI